MKKIFKITLALFFLHTSSMLFLNAQVSINTDNSNPDASAMLDVQSTDKGVLLPRLTSAQRTAILPAATGLLVFDTDTESFWFKDASAWVELVSGNVATLSDADKDTKIQVEESADEDVIRMDVGGNEVLRLDTMRLQLINNKFNTYVGAETGLMNTLGLFNTFLGYSAGTSNTTGSENTLLGAWTGRNISTASQNTLLGNFAGDGLVDGNKNVFIGVSSGSSNLSGEENTFIGMASGVGNTGSGNIFIGYRAGSDFNTESNRLSIDNSETSMPLLYGEFDNDLLRINGTLNINNAFSFPLADGSAGKVLETDGSGQLIWGDKNADLDNQQLSLIGTDLSIEDGNTVDLSSIDTDTDDQTIDVLNLNGTNLEISLADDGEATQTLDLASIDTDTDDQTIDVLNLNGTNLEISLADDGEATQSLDLASIDTDTDDQTIDVLNLNGTNLEISLADDGEATQSLDLASIDTDTDDQNIDVLNLNGTNLEISLADDGEATQTLDLASIDTDTDDQNIDVLNLNGTNLEISLADDGEATQSLDLSSIDTDTDDQTLTLGDPMNPAGFALLSIEDGNSVDLSVINTDNQNIFFGGTFGTNMLAITGGNQVDLSSLDTDTDDQTIDVLNLNGTNLEISLEDDGEVTQTLDLSSIDTDTDDQTIDVLNLNGTNLEISLEDDGEATQTLDLSSIDTDTDDQNIDVLNLNGTNLEISLADDGEATQTLDLSSIDTDTDDQNIDVLNLNGTNLEISLADDGEVTQTLDLSPINTTQSVIEDSDGSAKVFINESGSEYIGFNLESTNFLRLEKGSGTYARLRFYNNGNNIQIGNNPSISGTHNVVIGSNNTVGGQTISGNSNVLLGRIAGGAITTASFNTFIGQDAGGLHESGLYNIGIGPTSLKSNVSGASNVAIGRQAGFSTTQGGNVFLGNQAGYNETGGNTLYIDNSNTVDPLVYGDFQADALKINGTLEVTGDTKGIIPVGTVQMYIGSIAPSGWLICDGSNFDAATYPELNTLIGNNTLPDFTGRFPLGVGNSGTSGSTNHNLKTTGGEEKHTLTVAEMPAHTHDVTVTYREGEEQGSGNDYSDLGDTGTSSTYTSTSRGSNVAHNNMPPFYTINFIIKAE